MKKGILLLVVATLLWAGNYICGRFLAPALPATLLNTIRWAISTLILWGLLAFNKKNLPILSKWKEFLVLGFLGVFAFSTLNYLGLKSVSASQAGMISAGIPIIILFFTPFLLRENIKTKGWIGAIVSIIGVIILVQGKQANSSADSIVGEIEILLSCVAWALYTVLGKKYGRYMDPLTMTAGAAFYGTLFSAISCIGTVQPDKIHMTNSAWLAIIYVSTLASVVAYFAWNAGVKILGAGRAAPFINLLPVWTVILGILLLQEQVSGMTLFGGIIAIFGAILASL
ncbi:EamA family transporter [Priestia megaterium]|uniref:DMT family transporter n=1 Tax=Priestia megaterium TaxID=1404 RepID=UPI000BFA6CEA|nr:DMT family transporter [Priestia megaterium]MDP1442286.1 DMT family transporter [Priestia megaterium]MDP1471304.1 DMT family transporter [Priestia megaterium]PFP10094.1 EamA family transporter [Priestia megaterium]PFU63295.1 EamA family transporter [Priestia megaterium]